MRIKNILLIAFVLPLFITSCDNYLDELPDNRTTVDTKLEIQKLLVSAYPGSSPAMIAELSSDNIDDQGATNPYTELLIEEAAYWQDMTVVNQSDDSKAVWESAYFAIAHANQALEAIEEIGDSEDLSAEKGEALITRAYGHFILVNVFCKHYNETTSGTDLGIPYLEEPETTLNPQYDRGTVEDVYEKINDDIEAAIPLIDDSIYDVPAYHFTTRAANAFAARFNLYYGKWDKAITYANAVLGTSPESLLRSWSDLGTVTRDITAVTNAYIEDTSNLLTQAHGSNLGIYFGAYYSGSRMSHSRKIADEQTLFAPTVFSPDGIIAAANSTELEYAAFVYTATNLDKSLHYKIPYRFEYTDVVAGIGFRRTVLVPFTTDETLLVRAEAYIMSGLNEQAIADINLWTNNFYNIPTTVTVDQVDDFYNAMAYSSIDDITQKKELNPGFDLTTGSTQENMIHYVLQCRRLLTLHEGLRWYDIKRYGIAVPRYQIQTNGNFIENSFLTANDERKAIQIPQDVISAGMTANPR